MKAYIILFLFLSSFSVKSQEWFKNDAVWRYSYYNFDSRQGYLKITVEGEEMKGNILCKKIHLVLHLEDATQFPPPQWTEDLGFRYVYTENNGSKVNLFRDGTFYTMYDFSAEIGDTWTTTSANFSVNCVNGNVGQVQVSGKGTENINGTNIDYIELQTFSNSDILLYGRIYKYIGSRDMCFFPEYNYGTMQCGYIPEDALMSQNLICFNDGITSYGNFNCEYVANEESITKHKIKIFQNKKVLNIKYGDVLFEKITVFSIYGSNLISKLNTNKIDVSNLNKGVYIIEISNGLKTIRKKIFLN